ncbi:MAG: electron transfer flavoprotein subunit beta/FixA family protein, partial [Desulfobacterales bacterium]|nr:electron transfer flavoprotein subunit beta/FixA family protein [Desulfobacterales bacterium]
MRIYVCVKHVPDTAANIRITGANAFDESVKFVVNPYDEYGIEEAIRIAGETGGEVIIVTVGKAAAMTSVRSALAMGATRGILVETQDQFMDSAATALALKKAIEDDGQPDLIFCGKQSVDSEGCQTPYRLARVFQMPVVNDVVKLTLNNGRAMVEREIGGGVKEVVDVGAPCVLGATKGLNEPRYPKMPDILKAKRKKIKQIDIAALGVNAPAGKTEILELTPVPERSEAKMLGGGPGEAAGRLVDILKEEKILS